VPVELPFLPQEQITNSILSAIQLANQHSQAQQAAQIQQQNADTARQEAAIANSRANVEIPYIQAQTQGQLTANQKSAQQLAQNEFATSYLNGESGHGSEAHISGVVGNNGHYGVPAEAPAPITVSNPNPAPTPDQLNISSPVGAGQNLAVPAPPISTDTSAPVQSAPNNTTQSGPSGSFAQATPQGGVFADINEISRRLGGLTDQEASQVSMALREAQLNPNKVEALQKIQTDLAAIAQRRSQPEYAMQVSFMRKGMNEQQAIAAAKRNTAVDAQLTAIETKPEELAGDKASVAKGTLLALSQSDGLTPANRQRAANLASVAALAEKNQLAADAAKKKAEQAAKEGDANAAGQLLANGDVAPSELISSRNADFAVKAFAAAKKIDPTFVPQVAEAQFKAASSPANLTFFGPAHSLVDKGGTLDQLEAAAKDIPNGQVPIFNHLADAQKAALGSGPIAKYAAVALSVADDWSKVSGGGGSDTSREQALHLIPADASPAARKGSVEALRGSVNSQITSRVGNNKVLQRQYGIDSTPAPSASGPDKTGGLSHGASSYLSSIGVAH
jgi:hypothetical protein